MIEVGDVYEDCAYHPVWTTDVDYAGDDISGISLFDGSSPRSCSIVHCAPRKLTREEVMFKLQNRARWLAAESEWQALYATNDLEKILAVDSPYKQLLDEEHEKFGESDGGT